MLWLLDGNHLLFTFIKTKKEFMQHRKNQHISYVSEFRENENGCCRLSGQDCWFKHSDKKSNNDDENSSFKNSERIGRLFDMMEVFALRMKTMEDQMWRYKIVGRS